MIGRGWSSLASAVAIVAALIVPGQARVLQVGPGRAFPTLIAAARAARSGDVVRIDPGRYAQCAVWRADGLTIEGAGMDATVIHDVSCQGKAIFVVVGRGIVVRDLALTGARVPDQNGAGIRAEGPDLTVQRVRFERDQNGILARDDPSATLTVRNSLFRRDGSCLDICAHGLYAGRIGRLVVSGTTFEDIRVGHAIKSRALRTEITDSTIADGPSGTSSYLVDIPDGGALLLRHNWMEKGPHSSNVGTAVAIGEESARNPTPTILVAGNTLANRTGHPTVFVRNRTRTPAQLQDNALTGDIVPLVGPGSVR